MNILQLKGPKIKLHHEYGQVPKYLQKYQAQWEQDKVAEAEKQYQLSLPAGMREVGQDERLQILANLREAKNELTQTFDKYHIMHPDYARSYKSNLVRGQMEQKLRKIESAID